MKYSKIIVAVLVAVAATRTGVQAQTSTAQAETLFHQGRDLLAHGNIADACRAFAANQKLDSLHTNDRAGLVSTGRY